MTALKNKHVPAEVEIIPTYDGSHTLLNKELDETYHSRHGALQESRHVFIQRGLEVVNKNFQNSVINILEVGFGTGLNALLTLQSQADGIQINYTSLEAFPIAENTWSKLNYAESDESKVLFEKLHRANWDQAVKISPAFQLRKLHTTLQQVALEKNHYDLIYFDAFAPNKQPEMWELPMLKKIVEAMQPGGVFVTYCAKGQLKRDLQSLSLQVETLQGPPGKREMVRGRKG
ncbi:MAG TPA: tRNA (5-methylaminomethyl-2-thiouridine)(34)-methyltransferase MnmD [Cyclobacteriaceae bacterium]|nr:tRNA (5-methylaminomethyl-2-thiouridine)(34)-methyltransferase MnmD [Cyclobacteriaceae bacterium]